MSVSEFPSLQKTLESRVQACTGSRLRNLGIEFSAEGIRILGQTTTFYVKQLAQQCVREVLPDVRLVNDIHVV